MRDFAIQLTHRPGELARVANILGRHRVNLKAVAGLAIGTHVTIRIVPDDVESARAASEAPPGIGRLP